MDAGSRTPIQRIFATLPPGRVLDFGGGRGDVADLARASGHDVTIIDIDEALLARARERGYRTLVGDERALDDLKETFDYALLSHVVEHIQTPHETIVPRIHNVLREGGRAVIGVPNVARLRNRAGLVLGHFSDGMVYQHVRFFTLHTLADELAKGGLRVVEEHAWGYDWPTRLAMKVSLNMADELYVVAERPPGPLREIPKVRGWVH